MPTLELNETRLHYERCGTGAPVLMIQGIGVAGSGWNPQVDALSTEFDIATFDNRGLCESVPCNGPISIETMAKDALALMDALGWDSAHVVGHSMGGVIAQQLALDSPKRVRSLALMCTFDRGRHATRMTPWVVWMGMRTRLGTRRMRRRAFLEMVFSSDYLAGKDLDDLAEKCAPIMGRDLADYPPVMMSQFRATGRHDVFERLGELAGIPTVVASAEHDRIATVEVGRALAGAIPGARFVELAGVGHACTIQDPAKTNALLKALWSGAVGRSS